MNAVLNQITLKFAHTNSGFTQDLASLLEPLGLKENHLLHLTQSEPRFFPQIQLDFQSGYLYNEVEFSLSDGRIISLKIENATGISKLSPHSYRPIRIEEVKKRFISSGAEWVGLDHAGFNLPWFSPGLHPKIQQLREQISSCCLYHPFPTGEPWDFIIPADLDEIYNHKEIDYTRVRKPKFELVTFEKASTPLVQFDISIDIPYEKFLALFPESLNDPQFRNIWVYLDTPYAMDVCLVINETSQGDWSNFFKGSRICFQPPG
jgi:hypothetical protein